MRRFAFLAIVAACCSLGLLAAQSAHPQSPQASSPSLIDLNFPGGSVQQYIDAVRDVSDGANIVIFGDISEIPMPPVRLKGVDIWSAIRIINALPREQVDREVDLRVSIASSEPGQSPVFTIQSMTMRNRGLGDPNPSTVISVADVLDNHTTADDLLTAIQIAMEVGKAKAAAQIKFHKETGLLIANGSGEQIAALHQVIDQLRDQRQRASKKGPWDSDIQKLEIMNERIQSQLMVTAAELKLREEHIRNLESRIQQLEAELARVRAGGS